MIMCDTMCEMEFLWKEPKAEFTSLQRSQHAEKAIWLGTGMVITVEYVINVLKTQCYIFYGLGAQFLSFY